MAKFRTGTSDDPTKIPVQLNVKIPWDFKQFLYEKAESEGLSKNAFLVKALMTVHGPEFVRSQEDRS